MIEISLCMIVKNEERLLSRCLDSVADLFEEIIIVDTGSTDSTKEIAARYTDNLYDFRWIDDFSAARNFSLSKAHCDYIYIADADEIIDSENRQKFLQLKQSLSPEVDVVQMKYGNLLEKGTTYNFDVEYRPKLFKRVKPLLFRDPIHETLDYNFITWDSDIFIHHKPEFTHEKRDFENFQKVLKNGGKLSPKLHMMYARELYIAGSDEDFLDAYPYFESTLHDDWRTQDEVVQSECVVARVANIRDDLDLLFRMATKNLVGSPSCEVCCEIGDYYLRHGDAEEAATWYYTAAFGAEVELNVRYSGDIALEKLAEAFEALDEIEEASRYSKLARDWQPPEGDR